MSATLSHCGAAVRAADPDRFYAALLSPLGKREALFALLAFNHEVARLREIVSEGIIGEMRLAWWGEVLDEIEGRGKVRAHPVAEALSGAHRAHGFSLAPLRAILDARSFDLFDDPMPDMAALEAYARATGGGLHRVMGELVIEAAPIDPKASHEDALAAAESAGTAWALTGIVRALRVHSERRQLYLPQRELLARGISIEDVFAGRMSDGLHAVIESILAIAQDHVRRERALLPPRTLLPAIMSCALLPLHWRHMLRSGYDPFRDDREPGALARIATMLKVKLRGHI